METYLRRRCLQELPAQGRVCCWRVGCGHAGKQFSCLRCGSWQPALGARLGAARPRGRFWVASAATVHARRRAGGGAAGAQVQLHDEVALVRNGKVLHVLSGSGSRGVFPAIDAVAPRAVLAASPGAVTLAGVNLAVPENAVLARCQGARPGQGCTPWSGLAPWPGL